MPSELFIVGLGNTPLLVRYQVVFPERSPVLGCLFCPSDMERLTGVGGCTAAWAAPWCPLLCLTSWQERFAERWCLWLAALRVGRRQRWLRGAGLWEKRVAPDAGAVLALLSAGLQNCGVISSKGGHDLHVPLPLPALLYRGPVDLPEC